MKPPFPYFGGKQMVAKLIWQYLGDPQNYVEPFCGGASVLLARPGWDCERGAWTDAKARTETVNDMNAWICNVWRAIKADPDAVAYYAADIVSELDLHARGDWLFYRANVGRDFVERLRFDPDYYDVKSAGWWVWGQSSWIGDNWGRVAHNARKNENGEPVGVVRARPHLGHASMGINRQLPHLGGVGKGVMDTPRLAGIRHYMRQLCARLSRVRVCCGDWRRVLGPTPTTHLGLTGLFLDPPYAVANRDSVYGEYEDRDVAHAVREWCLSNGDNPLFRVALCGYDEHDMPASWRRVAWKAQGGYSNQGENGSHNRGRETIWFSPHCVTQVQGEQRLLFEAAT